MSLRKPTHDTLGSMDQIRYVSLGTMYRFSENQVAKIEPLTEIHEVNSKSMNIHVGILKNTCHPLCSDCCSRRTTGQCRLAHLVYYC